MGAIRSRRARLAAAGITTAIALLAGSALASAQTITVSGTGDGTGTGSCPASPCLLRQAINYADNDTQADTIVLGAHPYTITSSNGPLLVDPTHPLTITGQGAGSTTITQTSTTSSLVDVTGGSVAISGVTFDGGDAPAAGEEGGEGGAIYDGATLSLTGDAFTDNNANGGGAAGVDGGNSGEGGAIYDDGTLSVTASAFNDNQAKGGANGTADGGEGGTGGAIYIEGDNAPTLTNDTFTSNSADGGSASGSSDGGSGGEGGAIYNNGDEPTTLTDDTFTTNNANGGSGSSSDSGYSGEGGAIYNDAMLSLAGDTFDDNNANGGGASTTYGGEDGEGGAVYNDGVLNVTSGAFTGNDANGGGAGSEDGGDGGEGGAIYNNDPATISSSSFDGNEATAGTGADATYGEGGSGQGGAIYNEESLLVVESSTFGATSANQALDSGVVTSGPNSWGGEGASGGAIADYEGDDTLTGDTFKGNLADGAPSGNESSGGGGEGGAITVQDSDITIAGGSFTSNVASGAGTSSGDNEPEGGEGGAIGGDDSTIQITGASFTSNVADGAGAGTSDAGSGGEGGAVALYGGDLALSSVTLTGNQARAGTAVVSGSNYDSPGEGGALFLSADTQVTGSTFTSNSATASSVADADGARGGAVLLQYGADSSFANDTFTTNSAAAGGTAGSPQGGVGGAIDNQDGAVVTATADTFTGNTAPNGSGGALFADAPLWLATSTLTGNSAEDGGALYGETALVSVLNSTLDGNTAEATPAGPGDGGAIAGEIDALRLASDTIVANSAYYGDDDGGNLSLEAATLTIHDTIIAQGNLLGTNPSGEWNCDIDVTQFDDLGYNAEDNQPDGNECGFDATGDLVDSITLDAHLGSLASNGGPTQTVALLAGSPAIDAGDPAGCTDPLGNVLSVDQRGIARPQGSRCDIGAYEYVPPASTPAPPPPSTAVAPVLSDLALSPGVFLSVNGGGSTITYDDSEAGLTSFTVSGDVSGYKHGKKGACKELPHSGKRPKHSQSCTLKVTVNPFSHQDSAGTNDVLFPGQPNGQTLPDGTYTLSAKATLGGLTGTSVTTTFKIAG